MYDIHYHLLFGLDDGPKTLDEALQLAEASIAEGSGILSPPIMRMGGILSGLRKIGSVWLC